MMDIPLEKIPGWSVDLIWAAEIGESAWALRDLDPALLRSTKRRLSQRSVWMAVHVNECEMCKMAAVHTKLRDHFPELLTVLSPDTSELCDTAMHRFQSCGLKSVMWSPTLENYGEIDVLVVDPSHPHHVLLLSHLTGLVFVGCSLNPGMKGRSVAQACIANCAVVTGKNNEDFLQMTEDINQSSVVAAEEAEAVVYQSGMLHHSDDDGGGIEEEPDTMGRPLNGMMIQLASRTNSSPFSFVTDILMSSFPYPANTDRPQTAPPALREGSAREPSSRHIGQSTFSPVWQPRPHTAEYQGGRPRLYGSILEEEEEEPFRNISRASLPEEQHDHFDTVQRRDLSVFQISEEHHDTQQTGLQRESTPDVAELLASTDGEDQGHNPFQEDEDPCLGDSEWMESHPHPSPVSEIDIPAGQCETPDHTAYSDKSCSPLHTARQSCPEGSELHQDIKIMSPSGDYVMPATHLPYGTTGPAIWTIQDDQELTEVIHTLLSDPLQRRSRAHAASQGAARFAIGLVLEVWKVVFDRVVEDIVRTN